jgi:hypothetical protein
MSYISNVIVAPVSIHDVQSALGTGKQDLGELCTHQNVNRWAKYKPVEKALITTTPQLDSNNHCASSATWWKGTNGNCGITFTTFSTVASAKSAITEGLIVWNYIKPSGGLTAPFRLTDFNQYYHMAPCPTTSVGASDAQLKAGAILTIMVATSIADDLSLKLNHVGSLSDYYYLAALFTSSGELVLLHTSSKKVGDYNSGETVSIEIPYNNGSYGYQGKLTEGTTYKCFVMMSSVAYTCATSAQNGTYIPLPQNNSDAGLGPTDVRCLASSQYASVDAVADGRLVSWTVQLFGAGNPNAVTIQLINASDKSVVSGQSRTIDFSDGSTVITGGYERKNTIHETLTCSTDNIDLYMVEFIYSTIDVRATIKHDISPDL